MNGPILPAKVERFPLPGTELTGTIRILILDDDPRDRNQIHNLCIGTDLPVHVVEADGLASFRTALDKTAFDLLLIDYRLADGNGLDALGIIRRHNRNAGAAAIMIAGEAHVDVAVAALKNGCMDYIFKDALQVATMRRAIVSAIHRTGIRQDLVDAEQQRNRLETALAGLGDTSNRQIRPCLEALRRKLAALRVQVRRGAILESEAHLADIEALWQRMAQFCDQVEYTSKRQG